MNASKNTDPRTPRLKKISYDTWALVFTHLIAAVFAGAMGYRNAPIMNNFHDSETSDSLTGKTMSLISENKSLRNSKRKLEDLNGSLQRRFSRLKEINNSLKDTVLNLKEETRVSQERSHQLQLTNTSLRDSISELESKYQTRLATAQQVRSSKTETPTPPLECGQTSRCKQDQYFEVRIESLSRKGDIVVASTSLTNITEEEVGASIFREYAVLVSSSGERLVKRGSRKSFTVASAGTKMLSYHFQLGDAPESDFFDFILKLERPRAGYTFSNVRAE